MFYDVTFKFFFYAHSWYQYNRCIRKAVVFFPSHWPFYISSKTCFKRFFWKRYIVKLFWNLLSQYAHYIYWHVGWTCKRNVKVIRKRRLCWPFVSKLNTHLPCSNMLREIFLSIYIEFFSPSPTTNQWFPSPGSTTMSLLPFKVRPSIIHINDATKSSLVLKFLKKCPVYIFTFNFFFLPFQTKSSLKF